MNTQEFETKIKSEIDSNLSIKINPNIPDMAGVYYKDVYISVGMPGGIIKEEKDNNYRDSFGNIHRSQSEIIELIKAKLPKYKDLLETDPELFKNENI